MLMNELDEMTWAVAESVRVKFDPLVEINPISTNEFWVTSDGFAADIRVGEIVEMIQCFPFDGDFQVSLCDPDSLHLIVGQIGKWIASARNPATRLASAANVSVF